MIDKADAGAGVLSIWQSGGLALAGPLMTLGDILLFAGGPIVNVDPTDLAAVIGRNLDLRSVGGGIGNVDKRVAVQASGVVNLTAEADVYLRSQGDLNVDLLQALSGSVDLMAQSGIISVNQLSLATGDEASSEIVQTQAGGSAFARFQGQAIASVD